jgi:hypothetical protein
MKLLFVKANKVGSRIIRWGLKSNCSHFAVCFDEDEEGGGIVFHSYGSGPQLGWFEDFLDNYEVVYALSFKTEMPLAEEESIYKGLIRQYRKQWYDYAALCWWVWRGILFRFFKVPFPAKNAWSKNGYALCTALAGGFKWIDAWAKETGTDLEMIAPGTLYAALLGTGYFKDEGQWVDDMNALRW